MSIYIDKLIELKKRAEHLNYNDKKELDDLRRKSKNHRTARLAIAYVDEWTSKVIIKK